jgi:hypothetical protein
VPNLQPGQTATASRLNKSVQGGTASVAPTTSTPGGTFYGAAYNRGSVAVVFPLAFDAAPAVTVTADSSAPGQIIEINVTDVTATGCTIWLARTNTTTTTVYWIAVQP